MGKPGKHYTKEQILEAIKGSQGTVDTVAKRLKCGWITARKYIDKYPQCKDALQAEEEVMLDHVETVAAKMAMQGDGAMVRFILSTKGKRRGWNEDSAAGGTGGNVTIVFPREWAT